MAAAFADIALGFSSALGVGFHDALAKWHGSPVYDDGGSIVTPGTPVARPCLVQVDSATEAMRQSDGYTDGDARMLILAATLEGNMDTAATIEMLDGPHVGSWMIQSCERDPAGINWDCRGRRA